MITNNKTPKPWGTQQWRDRRERYLKNIPFEVRETVNRYGDKGAIKLHQCEQCHEYTVRVQVHHVMYQRGRDYWDYPDELLVAVCSRCHMKFHGLTFDTADWEEIFVVENNEFGDVCCDNCGSALLYGHVLLNRDSGVTVEVGEGCARYLTNKAVVKPSLDHVAELLVPDKAVDTLATIVKGRRLSFIFHAKTHQITAMVGGMRLTAYGAKGRKLHRSINDVVSAFNLAQGWAVANKRM